MKWALWGGLLVVVLIGCFFGDAALARRVHALQTELSTAQQAVGMARISATEPLQTEGMKLRVRQTVLDGLVSLGSQQADFLAAARGATALRQNDKGLVELEGVKSPEAFKKLPGLVDVEVSQGVVRGRWQR